MVLALDKRNLAPRTTPSLAFRLAVDPGGEHPRVEWLGECSVTSRDMAAVPSSPEERSVLDEAVAYLREVLAEGTEVPMQDIRRDAPCSLRTLASAKARARVVSRREGGRWLWSLPKDATAPPSLHTSASLHPCPNEPPNLLLRGEESQGCKSAKAWGEGQDCRLAEGLAVVHGWEGIAT